MSVRSVISRTRIATNVPESTSNTGTIIPISTRLGGDGHGTGTGTNFFPSQYLLHHNVHLILPERFVL